MEELRKLYRLCKRSRTNFFGVMLRFAYYRVFYGRLLLLHPQVLVRNLRNVSAGFILEVGIGYIGFQHPDEKTLLNLNGRLVFKGRYYSIGRGSRFDIARGAVVSIGQGGFMNANTTVIISHYLSIGDDCAIAWNCQFLDEDFHQIHYEGRKARADKGITIGNNVWIGCHVHIYQGTVIADGCVIAADSVVRGIFTTPNALIAGNPARMVKENISWQL